MDEKRELYRKSIRRAQITQRLSLIKTQISKNLCDHYQAYQDILFCFSSSNFPLLLQTLKNLNIHSHLLTSLNAHNLTPLFLRIIADNFLS